MRQVPEVHDSQHDGVRRVAVVVPEGVAHCDGKEGAEWTDSLKGCGNCGKESG